MEAIRDENRVPVALGVSSASATTTLPFKISSTTGRLMVDSSGGGGGGLSVITFTGTVNSSNTSFTAASAPTLIAADGLTLPATTSNGTVMWTAVGTAITMTNPPSFDIYGL